MTPERWRQVKDIFADALDRNQSAIGPFLDDACGDDRELRREVERLLSQAGATLRSPAGDLFPPAPSIAPGEMLAHFRVDSKIGEGGMGTVYRAFDTQLQRKVALKLLPSDQFAGPDARDRLMTEARAASALNHPNIVTIYEVGSGEGIDYIAMECVEGRPLGQLIPAGGMALKQALALAMEIADALTQAHNGGVVHRDLKPGNIMVTAAGHIKLLDFGLAQRAGTQEGETVSVTRQGEIAGTPAYMSPEQADGQQADERSDIFSFGAVLYEMLSGRRPFTGSSSTSVMAAVLRDDPTPMDGIAPSLEALVGRCLQKDPARRFQQMSEVHGQLEEIAAPQPAPAAVAPPPNRWRILGWAVPLGLALAGTGASLVYFANPKPLVVQPSGPSAAASSRVDSTTDGQPASADPRVRVRPLPDDTTSPDPVAYLAPLWTPTGAGKGAMRMVPVAAYPGMVRDPSFSPDGAQVAFSWNGDLRQSIYVKSARTNSDPPLRVTFGNSDEGATWSPHGTKIAFRRSGPSGGIYMVPPSGGKEEKVADVADLATEILPQMSWTADGNWLAAPERNPDKSTQITLFSVHNQGTRTMTRNAGGIDHAPAISPDGAFLAYASCRTVYACDVYVLPLGSEHLPTSDQPIQLTRQAGYIRGIAWMPDSRSVIYAAGHKDTTETWLWRARLFPMQPPERLDLAGSGVRHPTVSANSGRMAFTRYSFGAGIWAYRPDGKVDSVAFGNSYDFDPAVSSDGRRIAFSSRNDAGADIWTCDRDSSNRTLHRTRVTNQPGREQRAAAWSPDSRRLAYQSLGDDGQTAIYVSPAGGGSPRRLTPLGYDAVAPSWSRDGKAIYFSRPGATASDIWRIPVDGGSAIRVTDRGGKYAAESPDGTLLYYAKEMDPASPGYRTPLYVRPLAGGPETRLLDDVRWYGFTVVEGGIYYISENAAESAALRFYDFNRRQSLALAKVGANSFGRIAASSDGKTILYSAFRPMDWSLNLIENFR